MGILFLYGGFYPQTVDRYMNWIFDVGEMFFDFDMVINVYNT